MKLYANVYILLRVTRLDGFLTISGVYPTREEAEREKQELQASNSAFNWIVRDSTLYSAEQLHIRPFYRTVEELVTGKPSEKTQELERLVGEVLSQNG